MNRSHLEAALAGMRTSVVIGMSYGVRPHVIIYPLLARRELLDAVLPGISDVDVALAIHLNSHRIGELLDVRTQATPDLLGAGTVR